jgi:hypothetical protein
MGVHKTQNCLYLYERWVNNTINLVKCLGGQEECEDVGVDSVSLGKLLP